MPSYIALQTRLVDGWKSLPCHIVSCPTLSNLNHRCKSILFLLIW